MFSLDSVPMGRNVCVVDGCEREVASWGWCDMHYRRWRKHGDPLVQGQIQNRGMSEVDRFWARVDRRGDDECWEWTGFREPNTGYGRFTLKAPAGSSVRSVGVGAHRYSCELAHGPIPRGFHVCHRCDNPPCVNPAHLFAGTPADNIRDMDSKGRRRPNPPRGEDQPRSRLTDAIVLELRRRHAAGESIRAAAAEFGVSEEAAHRAAAGRTWRHLNEVPVPGWSLPPKRPRRRIRPMIGTGNESWHGTLSGSTWHGCGCERCRSAYTAYAKARRVRSKAD